MSKDRRGIMLSRECYAELKTQADRQGVPVARLGESFIRKGLLLPSVWEGKRFHGEWTKEYVTRAERPSPPLPGAGIVMEPDREGGA